MANRDDDFQARMKRVRARSGGYAAMPAQRAVVDDDAGAEVTMAALLRPQLALVLGAVALVAGRAFAMNYLMLAPSTEVLGWGEGAVVLLLLVGIGLLFGRSDWISHGALVVGAALGFLVEGYYIPIVPRLMEHIYNPDYVALVLLNAS